MRSKIFTSIIVAFAFTALGAPDNYDAILPVRGFCIAAPRPKGVDRFVKFIDTALAPRHVNTLVLRVDYNFQYKGHPEVADGDSLSLADVKKLVAMCRKDNIRLIPEIDLLGHQSYRTNIGGLLRAHPEFDETPWIKVPGYCRSYCPLHPQVHDVVFSVMDELCDAFECDAFHAGMDEVFYIGESQCPRCAGHNPAELFAGEVAAIHDHLQSRGRQMWMWGDRLLDSKAAGVGKWEASEAGTAPAIDLIPKDVMICDWHYESAVPTPAYFAIKGFHVIMCPWKKASVAVDEADDMVRWRSRVAPELREHFEGVMQTVWSSAERFLDNDYGVSEGTNSWNCFTAMSSEIKKLAKKPVGTVRK